MRMEIDLSHSDLRLAQTADWRTVADIAGEAFADDPVNRFIFGKDTSIRSMFRVMARALYMPHGFCHLHPAGGSTMWMPPGTIAEASQLGLLKFALGQLRHGTPGAIRRGLGVSEQMQEWHPSR